MKKMLVIAMMGLMIGLTHGEGVKEVKRLVSESREGEIEAMKILNLVTGDLTEDGVVEVLGWVIENGGADERKRVGEILPAVPQSERLMLRYVKALNFFGEKEQLVEVIRKMKKGKLQREARFQLASLVAEDAERNLTLTEEERAKRNQEAAVILRELGRAEGLEESLKKRTGKLLFKVTHLVVGCEAPEIEGVDQEGKKFRLSEYRGKVVVLPFWGYW